LTTVFMTAIGLAMDAFAASVANGVCVEGSAIAKRMLVFGASFGAAQAIMPVAGYYFAETFLAGIMRFAGIIAFVVLLIIGGKMIFEGSDASASHIDTSRRDTSLKTILALAVATSIDALAVGASLSLLDKLGAAGAVRGIAAPAAIIGAVAFVFSAAGVYIGCKVGKRLSKLAEIIGGCVLIFIGIKMLF
jgi:putative Mn2+ efflux pump MntP